MSICNIHSTIVIQSNITTLDMCDYSHLYLASVFAKQTVHSLLKQLAKVTDTSYYYSLHQFTLNILPFHFTKCIWQDHVMGIRYIFWLVLSSHTV